MNATVGWNANTDEDLAVYYVYRGTLPGVYTTVVTVGPLETSVLLAGLPDVTHYFAVQAIDTSGNGSVLSQEVSKTSVAFLLPCSMS